jgi:putative ATP-grasp target RiPP
MLIELITPLILATAPTTITVPEVKYDHVLQVSRQVEVKTGRPVEVAQRPTTWNGTQTYDYNGKPRDSDND